MSAVHKTVLLGICATLCTGYGFSYPTGDIQAQSGSGGESMPGPAGPAGRAGCSVLFGHGQPSAAQGNACDLYIDQDDPNYLLYGPKTMSQVWPLPGHRLVGDVGARGPPGADGNSIVGPAGAPGRDGNSIVGPQGSPGTPGRDGNSIVGPQGVPGVAGKDGRTIYNGAGAPANALGNANDFYVDVSNPNTYYFYGPKTLSAWPASGIALGQSAGGGGLSGTDVTILSPDSNNLTLRPTTDALASSIPTITTVGTYSAASNVNALFNWKFAQYNAGNGTTTNPTFKLSFAATDASAPLLLRFDGVYNPINYLTLNTNTALWTFNNQVSTPVLSVGAGSATVPSLQLGTASVGLFANTSGSVAFANAVKGGTVGSFGYSVFAGNPVQYLAVGDETGATSASTHIFQGSFTGGPNGYVYGNPGDIYLDPVTPGTWQFKGANGNASWKRLLSTDDASSGGSSSGGPRTVVALSAGTNTQITAAQSGALITLGGGGTAILPTAATGLEYTLLQLANTSCRFLPQGGDTITVNGVTSAAGAPLYVNGLSQYATLTSNASGSWFITNTNLPPGAITVSSGNKQLTAGQCGSVVTFTGSGTATLPATTSYTNGCEFVFNNQADGLSTGVYVGSGSDGLYTQAGLYLQGQLLAAPSVRYASLHVKQNAFGSWQNIGSTGGWGGGGTSLSQIIVSGNITGTAANCGSIYVMNQSGTLSLPPCSAAANTLGCRMTMTNSVANNMQFLANGSDLIYYGGPITGTNAATNKASGSAYQYLGAPIGAKIEATCTGGAQWTVDKMIGLWNN